MTTQDQTLIDGEELRKALEGIISNARAKLVFASAYITQSAVDWLASYLPEGVDVHLICRLIPSDVISGATHISALATALENGWKVSCLHSLHAKVYACDSVQIYVGSANLTSNGLRIHGDGNLEACCKIPPNEDNLRFVANIEGSASPIDHAILQKMEQFIAAKEPVIHFDKWPEGTLPEDEGVWVRDFFWFNPASNQPQGNEKTHDMEIISTDSLDQNSKKVRAQVGQARCIQWLISKLKEQDESELYFGNLTRLLHNELKDDPAPYRKDVKGLVQNLLAYCEIYLAGVMEISRPNHSQRIKLLVTS